MASQLALSVKRTFPAKTKMAIQSALVKLKQNDPVIKALKITGLRAAMDREYDPLRQAAGMVIPERKKNK